MRVRAESDGSLVLSYDSTRLSAFMFAVAAVLLAGTAYEWLAGSGDADRLIGFIGATAICTIAGMALLERARAVVNPVEQRLVWSRRWAFRTRSGSLKFADVVAVLAERPLGDSGVPSRRIVVCTRSGDSIPLTAGYRPDGDGVILHASERIREMIGLDASADGMVKMMVESGRKMDAIAWLREQEGLSLTEAKQRVDAMGRSR